MKTVNSYDHMAARQAEHSCRKLSRASLLLRLRCLFCVASAFLPLRPAMGQGPGTVVAWGDNSFGQLNVPAGLSNVVAIDGGDFHSLALKNDGTVVAWGDNSYGQRTGCLGLTGVVAIASGNWHNLALKADTTVAAWGDNWSGQTNVPTGLTNVVSLAAGAYHSLALRSDGTVVGWGRNDEGQTNVPVGLAQVVAIAAGDWHSVALRIDGTVVAWGDQEYGQASVPAGLTNAVAIAAGGGHSLALTSDGRVLAWGDNGSGQTNVPAGLTSVVAIAGGGWHSLALISDGQVLGWGSSASGQTNSPAGLTNLVAIAAGRYHSLALLGDGSPFITLQPAGRRAFTGSKATFQVMAAGSPHLTYQWRFNGTNTTGATDSLLVLPAVALADSGNYQVVVSNVSGAVTSAVAHLDVVPPPVLLISATSYTVAEDVGSVPIGVVRGDDGNLSVTVDFVTIDGTATNGVDYIGVTNTLTFAPGDRIKLVPITILNDSVKEPSKSFRVTLSNPTGGGVLGSVQLATVWISDNDPGAQFEFNSTTFPKGYTVAEDAGFVLVGVTRGDDGTTTASVDFATSDLTATNALDYTATNGTLVFAPGEKVKLFTVPIFNDGLKEGNETFRVTLSNPTNCLLGPQKTVDVTILDNDPGVQFEFNEYWAQETEGGLTVKVLRGNDMALGPFTVDFATANLTATAGRAYQATTGTLAFAQGEIAKTVTVPILYDEQLEPDRQFKLTLSNPSGGLGVGPNSTVTNTIFDTTGLKPHRFDGVALQPDGSVRFTLGGGVSKRFKDYFDLYPIEFSSNLVDWTPLVTLQRTNASTNILTCTDTATTNNAARFYRTPATNLITPFFLKPTGPYPVGVISRFVTDPTRRNRYNVSTNGSFMVSVWYPAVAEAGRLPARWMESQVAHPEYLAVYKSWATTMGYTVVGDALNGMPHFVTYALQDAACTRNQSPYPVVLYSPSYAGLRSFSAQTGPNLASHGYVVVSVDHWDMSWTVFPDGTALVSGLTDTTGITDITTKDRLRDMAFVLDELARWNTNDVVLAGRLDLTKVAAMGGCWGATVAPEFCRIDDRCKAAIILDGTPSMAGGTDILTFSLQKPFLSIYNGSNGERTLFSKAIRDAIRFQINGVVHEQIYGDVLYWVEFPGQLATGHEAARTINAYSLWFLNKYLKGSSDPMPAVADYPLVRNFQQK